MALNATATSVLTAVASATANVSSSLPSPLLPDPPPEAALETARPHHANAVVAFMIGLGIVTLASIMNAAGLNLTKLDHVGIHSPHEFSFN